MTWADKSRHAIEAALRTLPGDANEDDRRKAIDAAYPFGERSLFPYKAWLRVRREYLRPKNGGVPRGYMSPLDRAKLRAIG
jgi:hypothetical protein